MNKKFEIGQRVKVLEHKGTCFENATGIVVEIDEDNCTSRIEFVDDKNGISFWWFIDSYLEVIEDEPKQELTQEQVQTKIKTAERERIYKALKNEEYCVQKTIYIDDIEQQTIETVIIDVNDLKDIIFNDKKEK